MRDEKVESWVDRGLRVKGSWMGLGRNGVRFGVGNEKGGYGGGGGYV